MRLVFVVCGRICLRRLRFFIISLVFFGRIRFRFIFKYRGFVIRVCGLVGGVLILRWLKVRVRGLFGV